MIVIIYGWHYLNFGYFLEYFFYKLPVTILLMRLFRFLSKFTFICNIAFLLFVFFRWIEMKKPVTGSGDRVIALPFLKDLVITLGFSAIIINLLMNIFYFIFLIRGKLKNIAVGLPVINFMFLLLQIAYFFFY